MASALFDSIHNKVKLAAVNPANKCARFKGVGKEAENASQQAVCYVMQQHHRCAWLFCHGSFQIQQCVNTAWNQACF
jgi:hypothetical protein